MNRQELKTICEQHGGKLEPPTSWEGIPTTPYLDGEEYEYRATFKSLDMADAFLDEIPFTKCGQDQDQDLDVMICFSLIDETGQ